VTAPPPAQHPESTWHSTQRAPGTAPREHPEQYRDSTPTRTAPAQHREESTRRSRRPRGRGASPLVPDRLAAQGQETHAARGEIDALHRACPQGHRADSSVRPPHDATASVLGAGHQLSPAGLAVCARLRAPPPPGVSQNHGRASRLPQPPRKTWRAPTYSREIPEVLSIQSGGQCAPPRGAPIDDRACTSRGGGESTPGLACAQAHRSAPPNPAPPLPAAQSATLSGVRGWGERAHQGPGKNVLRRTPRTAMLVRGSAVDHDGAGIVRPSPPRAPRPASLRWDRSPGQRRAGTTMAPAASRLRTEAALAALPRRALAHYLLLLRLYPVLAKAASRWARGRGEGSGERKGRLADPAAPMQPAEECGRQRRSPRSPKMSSQPCFSRKLSKSSSRPRCPAAVLVQSTCEVQGAKGEIL
jgi:hypothetical protein